MNKQPNTKGKPTWSFPWSYKEGVIFALGFLIVGVTMELINPLHLYNPPQYPFNVFFLAILVIVPVIAKVFWNDKQLVVWLSSIKSSVPAILLFSSLVLLIAIVPQKQDKLPAGLHVITRTWYFTFSALYLAITLSFAISKRIFPITRANIAFTMNHLGLWICITAGLLGYGDKQEVKIQANTGQLVWYGINQKGNSVDLPIAFKLEQFIAEYYTPKPAIMVRGSENLLFSNTDPNISKDSIFTINNTRIIVHQYFQHAYISDSGFIDARGVPFTGPAALVEVVSSTGKNCSGWIAPDCASFAERYLTITPDSILRLLPPEPKYYASDILLYTKSGISGEKHRIEVNSPLKVDGWFIYQYGYDNRAGADSTYSVLLAVYDPWLNVVYIGMLLILVGSILMSFNYFNKNQH